MSNIDERVVRMEFDNKAFEKNAGETMSTLDKLKNILNFDNVKGSFAKITNAAKKVDVSNVSDGIETVNAKLSTMQIVGATAISKITSGLMDFGKKVVGGTFGQIVQGGINRAFNIEQAKFTIEGLDKDFVQLKEDINYAVSGTAYGFDEAAKAASMMAASGIEAGDQMKASLRGISGMAAMTGDSYSNIADIFGNIAGKGKLSLQEVNRFATRGINVAAKLAEQLGESEQTVREMISEGEISFEQFAAAMDDAFGAHATEANKTFTGAMSNIKASLSRIGEAFIHPLMETNEKDALLLQTYKDMNPELIKLAQNSNKAFENGVNARTALNNVIKDSKKVFGITNDEIKWAIDGNEKEYIKSIKNYEEYAGYTTEQLKKVYKSDQKEIFKVLSKTPEYANKTREELRAILATGKEQFIEQARQMDKYSGLTDEKLGKLYDDYSGIQYNAVTVLQAFKRMLGNIESAVSNSGALKTFIEIMTKASEALSLFFNAVSASLSGGILTLSQQVEKINKNGEKITDTIEHTIKASKLWDSFRKALGLTTTDFENLKDTVKGVFSVFQFLGDIVSSFFEVISSGTGIARPFLSIILAITGTIGRLVSAVLDSVRSFNIIGNIAKVISGILRGIIGIITAVVNVIVSAFTMITNNPVFDNIVHTLIIIGEGFDLLFTRIYDAGSAIVRFFIAPFRKASVVTEGTGHIVTSVLELIADALWDFNKGLKSTIEKVDEFITTFIDFAGISRTGKKLATIFKDGFGLDNIFGGADSSVFGDAMAGMSADLTKSEEKASKKINGEGLGKVLGGAIFTGIAFAVKALWKGFTFLADSLIGIIEKIDFNKVADFIFKGLENISLIVISGIELVSNALNKIGDIFSKVDYSDVASKAGKAIDGLVDSISKVFGNLSNIISGAIDKIANNMPAFNDSADKIGVALGNIIASGLNLVLSFVPLFTRIIVNALKTLVSKMPSILGKFTKSMGSAFGDAFTGFFKKIYDALKNVSFIDILTAINLAELAIFLKELISILKSVGKAINLFDAASNMMNGVGEALKGVNKALNAYSIKQLIISVGLLIALSYIVGKLDKKNLVIGLSFVSLFGLWLTGFVWLMSNATPGADKIWGFAAFMHTLGDLIKSIGIALALLSILKPAKLLGSVGALGLVLLGLAVAINMLQGCEKAMNSAKMLGPMVLSIAGALAILSLFKFETIMGSVLAIGIIIGALVIAAQHLSSNITALGALKTFGPTILMIAGALALLSSFDFGAAFTAALTIAAVLGVLVGISAAASLPAVAAGLTVLTTAILVFSVAVIAVGAGMYIFVSALQLLAAMGKDGSIASLGTAIQQLSSYIPILFQGIGQGILVMVQTLADGATIIADAFMNILQTILERLMQSAVMFATVGVTILLTLLNGILSAIGQITDTVIKIITAFTSNVSANMGSIVDSGMQLMISFINGMANGLNAHSEEIWAAVKNLVGEIINFILTGLQSLVKEIPFIGGQISDGIEGAKGEIEKFFGDGKIEKETKKGAKGLTKAVDSETKSAADKAKKNTDKIPKAMDNAATKSKKSFKGVGKTAEKEFKEIPGMADLAKEMSPKGKASIDAWTKKFSEGAKAKTGSDAISKVKNGAESVDFGPAGTQVFNGFSSSFNYSSWYNQGVKRASAVNKGFRDTEDIKSPSKVWDKYGQYLYEGLANNMKKTATKFYNTGAGAARGINNGFNSAIDLLSSLDLDSISEPTIRPVMDLSNVKMGASQISSMFSGRRYAFDVAGSLASSGIRNSRSMTVNANLTVNGAENGAEFADEFIQELEVYERTYNG